MRQFQLTIVTPQGEAYNGSVEGVQAPGSDGQFVILNDHAPMIAALGDGDLIIKGGTTKGFKIKSGFLEVQNDGQCIVMTSQAEK